jgi:secondary thiamine-phosphate synthase enzyme
MPSIYTTQTGQAAMVGNEWIQREISLRARRRGIYLITDEIQAQLPELKSLRVGTANLFLLHTSAGVVLNESLEPEVRNDMGRFLDRLVPEGDAHYQHAYEGPDDMPAHIKNVLTGTSLTVPIRDGALWLGTWQGIYLCEFRNRGGVRRLAVTLHGSSSST